VAQGSPAAFLSYSREDSDFALRLAGDLKAADANVWLDRLDIVPGDRWDRAIEDALKSSSRMVVILSPASVGSTNVMDEVSFALEEKKPVIPIIYRDCAVPFRLRRLQYVDFRQDYARGLQELLRTLVIAQGVGHNLPAITDVERQSLSNVPGVRELQASSEQPQGEKERGGRTSAAPLEADHKQPAEQARVEQERRRAPGDRLKPSDAGETKKPEHQLADSSTKERVPNTGASGAPSASKLGPLRIVSPTIRYFAIAGAAILIVAIASRFNYRSQTSDSATPPPAVSDYRDQPRNGVTTNPARDTGTAEPSKASAGAPTVEHWQPRNSGVDWGLNSIFATSDAKQVWVVGESPSTILKSEDGGEHWRPLDTGLQEGHYQHLSSIFGTSDGKRLWAVGANDTLLVSDDRGEHWNLRKTSNDNFHDHLQSIFGTSDGMHLWVGGTSTTAQSDDGGEHWIRVNGRSVFYRMSIFATSDGKQVWIVGRKGTVVESVDSGKRWNPLKSGAQQDLFSIFGSSDGKQLWTVGEKGTILKSDDGGELWNRRDSGTQNFLSSVFGSSDGKRLWAVGGGGTILKSGDGGEHWDLRNSGTQNALMSVFGSGDGKRLWAVGEKGTILEALLQR
jgi:photosystem II stability/assembly factor-like uncharacterized protein